MLAIVGLCVAAAVRGGGGATQIDQSKPEGVVQAFLNSVIDRDFETSVTFLPADTKCTVADFDSAYIATDMEVTLRSSTSAAGSATVDVSVTTGGDPFGGGYTEQHIYRLAEVGGKWLIKGTPWPLYQCGATQ